MKEFEEYILSNGKQILTHLYNSDKLIPIRQKVDALICDPFMVDKEVSSTLFIQLARAFQSRNMNAVRFDYYGTGDSEGTSSDCTLNSMQTDIVNVIKNYEKRTLGNNICLIGLGLSSYHILKVIETVKYIKAIILIDPVLDVKKYLHEILRRQLLKELITSGSIKQSRSEILKNLQCLQYLDIGGYKIGNELLSEIQSNPKLCVSSCIETLVIHFSPDGNETKKIKYVKKEMKKLIARITFKEFVGNPINQRSGMNDYSEVVGYILKWMQD